MNLCFFASFIMSGSGKERNGSQLRGAVPRTGANANGLTVARGRFALPFGAKRATLGSDPQGGQGTTSGGAQ